MLREINLVNVAEVQVGDCDAIQNSFALGIIDKDDAQKL
jgi:hypothetical protein